MIMVAALMGALVGMGVSWAANSIPRLAYRLPVSSKTALSTAVPPLQQARPNGHKLSRLQREVGLVSALLFAYFWARFGISWALLCVAGSYSFFLLIALVDLQYRLVLNLLVYPAIIAILFFHLWVLPQALLNMLLGGILAFSIFFLTAWLRPGQLGGGDIKLATLIGLAFGFPGVLWVLLVGAGTAGGTAVYLLLARGQGLKGRIPYAPFLCLGAMVALLYSPWPGLH
jgi:prepilin signal peptidase PulO-like enzyme (type II secretory pathway)